MALNRQVYDLDNFELLWERKEDTKVLLAWNAERIVLSFRGTASWANVRAVRDLGALQSRAVAESATEPSVDPAFSARTGSVQSSKPSSGGHFCLAGASRPQHLVGRCALPNMFVNYIALRV